MLWANLLCLLQLDEAGEVVYGHAGFTALHNLSSEDCTAAASENHSMKCKGRNATLLV
jgi:hypothetical protein